MNLKDEMEDLEVTFYCFDKQSLNLYEEQIYRQNFQKQ